MTLRIALVALLLAAPIAAVAQVRPAPPPEAPAVPQDPPIPREPDDVDVFGRSTRAAFRLGQDYRLGAGDIVREAVVVFGDATVAGEVDQNLVVILGDLHLMRSAIIRGNVVSVGGTVTAESGVTARGDFVVVGGNFDAPVDFMPGGGFMVVGGGPLRDWLRELAPYLTRGLLWGRLIVPELSWTWSIVGLFFFLYVGLNLLFPGPVGAGANTLAARPLTSFGVGLLVLLLVGPVCLLLAVSVVGLAVVPFVIVVLTAGWMVGKVAVARWLGMSIVAEDTGTRVQGTRSVVMGFVLISLAYLVPVIGIATWAVGGVLGLGASARAFLSAYRRENPKPVADSSTPDQPWRGWGAAYRRGARASREPAADAPPPPVPATYSTSEPVVPPPVPPATATSAGVTEPPPAMAFEAMGTPGGAAAAAIPLPGVSPSVLASMPKALFRDRLAAFVLDVVLLIVVVNIFSGDPDEWAPLLVLGYHVVLWTWKQTTVGGLICQIRIVRTDGGQLTFADALIRALASIFSLGAFFIGALWMLRDPESQTWHDKIAGTYVVKVPRSWPV
jgi:uncharacterized RDD family membrane protein YckC